MSTINVSQAEGPVLDWLVAKIEGFTHFTDGISWVIYVDGTYRQVPRYSADWSQGGPIIEREWLHVESWQHAPVEEYSWSCVQYDLPIPICTLGPTPLIAAMRCFVVSKLGETVEVPEELT